MRGKIVKDDDFDDQVPRRPSHLHKKPSCYVIYYNSPEGVWKCKEGTTTGRDETMELLSTK